MGGEAEAVPLPSLPHPRRKSESCKTKGTFFSRVKLDAAVLVSACGRLEATVAFPAPAVSNGRIEAVILAAVDENPPKRTWFRMSRRSGEAVWAERRGCCPFQLQAMHSLNLCLIRAALVRAELSTCQPDRCFPLPGDPGLPFHWGVLGKLRLQLSVWPSQLLPGSVAPLTLGGLQSLLSRCSPVEQKCWLRQGDFSALLRSPLWRLLGQGVG